METHINFCHKHFNVFELLITRWTRYIHSFVFYNLKEILNIRYLIRTMDHAQKYIRSDISCFQSWWVLNILFDMNAIFSFWLSKYFSSIPSEIWSMYAATMHQRIFVSNICENKYSRICLRFTITITIIFGLWLR